jgi:hypothetical protein
MNFHEQRDNDVRASIGANCVVREGKTDSEEQAGLYDQTGKSVKDFPLNNRRQSPPGGCVKIFAPVDSPGNFFARLEVEPQFIYKNRSWKC